MTDIIEKVARAIQEESGHNFDFQLDYGDAELFAKAAIAALADGLNDILGKLEESNYMLGLYDGQHISTDAPPILHWQEVRAKARQELTALKEQS